MNKIILTSFAFASLLVGCDYNDKFEGLVTGPQPTDVKNAEYLLTPDDYKAIAENSVNKQLAKANGVEAELANLTKTQCFTDKITGAEYLPAFFASKWIAADDKSSVKATYMQAVETSALVSEIATASIYKVSAADYESVWGAAFNFFTPATPAAKHIPQILSANFPEAIEGDIKLVDYNQSENEPAGSVVTINETFEEAWSEKTYTAEVAGWNNVITEGSYAWGGYVRSENNYLNASAYKHEGVSQVYMISPKVSVLKGMTLSFDACYGNYMEAGGRLSLLVSEDLAGFEPEAVKAATWIDLSDNVNIEVPEGTFGTLSNVCNLNMDDYMGKKLYIAFRYDGDGLTGATTTVQMDNVVLKSEAQGGGTDVYAPTAALFKYSGSAWSAYTQAMLLTKADFKEMGSNYDNFSTSMNPDNYLPVFLANKYPYAQLNDVKTIAYKYYAGSTTVVADEYCKTATGWVKNSFTEQTTEQFVKNNGSWKYNPSTVIVLPNVKDGITKIYMQTAVDWVWENIDQKQLGLSSKGKGYVSSYGNNDYYGGFSAYYGNIDWRVSAAKAQYAQGFEGLSDDEITNLLQTRMIEVWAHVLTQLNPSAKPVDGIEVIYTIQFVVYDGANKNCQAKYKVTAPATFEYIEDSFGAAE